MYNTDGKMEMLGKDYYLLKYIYSRGKMFIQNMDNKHVTSFMKAVFPVLSVSLNISSYIWGTYFIYQSKS